MYKYNKYVSVENATIKLTDKQRKQPSSMVLRQESDPRTSASLEK